MVGNDIADRIDENLVDNPAVSSEIQNPVLERRVAGMEQNIERMTGRVLAEEKVIEKLVSRKTSKKSARKPARRKRR